MITIMTELVPFLLVIGAAPELKPEWKIQGHEDRVAKLVFSPDGMTLASCSNDKTAKLWDPANGKLKQTLKGHASYVWRVAFSPNNKLLATGSHDKTMKLWDVSTGKEITASRKYATEVTAVAFSPDGRKIALGCGSPNGTAHLWDLRTRKESATLEKAATVTSLSFSPDGKSLAGGDLGGDIGVWDTATGKSKATVEVSLYAVKAVQYFSNGKSLLTACRKKIIIRDPINLKATKTINAYERMPGLIRAAAISPSGKLVVSAGEYYDDDDLLPGSGEIKLWDAVTGKLLAKIDHPNIPITCVAFSPDGKKIAAGDYDGVILSWDVESLLRKPRKN